MKTQPCVLELVPGSRPDIIPFIGSIREEAYPENAEAHFWCCWQLHCQHRTSYREANICKQLDVIPPPQYTGDHVAWALRTPTDQGCSYTPHPAVFPEGGRTGEAPELAGCGAAMV